MRQHILSLSEKHAKRLSKGHTSLNDGEMLGAHIVAPCMHEKACPMKGGQWCSFAQRVQKDIKTVMSIVVIC